MEDVTIGDGFTEDEREHVAGLYYEAFGRKLRPGFVDEATGRTVVRAALRSDHLLVARQSGRVVGACGASTVRLSVVDVNARARALCERHGFTPAGRGTLGALSAVYGFDGYTTRELEVSR